jgi:preprotein translocase subunit SecG
MAVLLIILHVLACIGLIMIVLLQTGKGADMGAAFGGGSSQTLFGSSGAGTFFGKATTAIAVIFMVTSLTLAYMSTRKDTNSIMMETAPFEETVPGNQEVPIPVETPADQQDQTE